MNRLKVVDERRYIFYYINVALKERKKIKLFLIN